MRFPPRRRKAYRNNRLWYLPERVSSLRKSPYPHSASQTMASTLDRFGRPHPSPHPHEHTCTRTEHCTRVMYLWYVCSRGQAFTGPASGGSGDRDLHPASRQLTKHGASTAQGARTADLDLPNGGNNLKLYTTTRSRNPLLRYKYEYIYTVPRRTSVTPHGT